jgi:hypothetical protein
MRRSIVFMVSAILITMLITGGFGLLQASPVRASNPVRSFVAHHDVVGGPSIVVDSVRPIAAATTDTTPTKRTVKKETLWLMIGMLASVAIAGLVSALRRAKKIRED